MDWSYRINRAVCWRPAGGGHTPTGMLKMKEREPDQRALEELLANSRHVLSYLGGTKVEQQRKHDGEQSRRSARVTPSDPDTAHALLDHGFQNPPTPTVSFNIDVLTTIFMHLADSPIESPPIFRTGTNDSLGSFLTISRVGNPPSQPGSQQPAEESLRTLRACSLVSKAWHHAAVKLLWYTAVLNLKDLEEELGKWSRRIYEVVEDDAAPDYKKPTGDRILGGYTRDIQSGYAPQRKWVRRLILIGGGTKSATPLLSRIPLQNIWDIFSCVRHVEIFGYGWGTDGLLGLEVDPRLLPRVTTSPRRLPSFHHIRNLDVTATSEYLLRGKVPGQNFLEVAKFLLHLRALRSLTLRGFTYRVCKDAATTHISNTASHSRPAPQFPNGPSTSRHYDGESNDISRSPAYALEDLILNKCSLSLVALRWIVGNETYATLGSMEVAGCSFWDEEDMSGIWNMDEEVVRGPKAAFEAMAQRLSVDLPVFSMSTS